MKLFKNCEECRKLIQEDYQDIKIIDNLCIMPETLTSIINMVDEIGQYCCNHTFKESIKIQNLFDENGLNPLKGSIISMGWGERGITSQFYYITYNVKEDVIGIEDWGNEGCFEKTIPNVTNFFLEIEKEKYQKIRESLKAN